MPRHHTRSPSLLAYVLVFAAGALAATCMSRREAPASARRRGDDHPVPGMAAISPKAAQDACDPDAQFVRPAGRGAMRDPPRRWEREDEAADESFPASDPPANY